MAMIKESITVMGRQMRESEARELQAIRAVLIEAIKYMEGLKDRFDDIGNGPLIGF